MRNRCRCWKVSGMFVSVLLATNLLIESGAADWSAAIDTEPPTVTIMGMPETVEKEFSIRIVFTEVVKGFSHTDVTAKNAKLEEFTGEGANYHVKVVPDRRGPVTIVVSANTAVDAAGNIGPVEDISATAALPANVADTPGSGSSGQGEKDNAMDKAIDEAYGNLVEDILADTPPAPVPDDESPKFPVLAMPTPSIDPEDEDFVDMDSF